MATTWKCVICKHTIHNDKFGNNPQPIKAEGRCCSDCNAMIVVPSRMSVVFYKRVMRDLAAREKAL